MDVVFTGLVAARTPPESLNPTHPPPIPHPSRHADHLSLPVTPGRRRHRPLGRSRTRSYHPCPPLPYNVEAFTSLQFRGTSKSNISEPYHCQHPPFLPSLPPIHPKRSMDKCRTCTKYTKQLSLSLRETSAGNVHSSAKAPFPSHPSIHPYDTLISSHTLICILSKKSNPILQFQHLPKLSSQTCTSLLYCSSAFLTISQTPLRLPPNKHRHIS